MTKKILIADSLSLIHQITQSKQAKQYQFASAINAEECLHSLDSFQPDLLLVDLMLPHMHGIEILKKIKGDPNLSHIKAIILAAEPMIQNYHSAIKEGAAYFLSKPFDISDLFSIIEKLFAGKLTPGPFQSVETSGHPYNVSHSHENYIKFWGTRGSHSASGPAYVRFGGNSSCLEVRHGKELVIIDSGSGIIGLGDQLIENKELRKIHLFISHTHLDHISGFAFFKPLYDPSFHIHIHSPVGYEKSNKDMFTNMLADYLPIRMEDFKAKMEFHDLRDGDKCQVGNIKVCSHYAFHPGPTLCFTFHLENTKFGYVTDNELLMGYLGDPKKIDSHHPLLTPHIPLMEAIKNVDFLVHEAQYNPEEYQKKVGWGHSSVTNAAAFIKCAEVKEWIVTHHDPLHTDNELLKKIQLHHDILTDIGASCPTRMAFDGLIIPI